MQRIDIRDLGKIMSVLSVLTLIFFQNGLLMIVGYGVLLAVIAITWKQFMPNVFTFILVFHWVQIFTYILFVNNAWSGDLNFLTNSSLKAYLAALTGILVMSYTFNRIAYRKLDITRFDFESALEKIKPKKVLYLYLILYVLSAILSRIASGGVAQLFVNIALLKWAGFVLLGYLSFKKKEYRIFFAIAFVLDFIGGFFSFFSTFKEVFFYTAIIIMTYVTKITFNVVFKIAVLGSALFFLAVVWTVVKGDYRDFLNEGSKQQVVVVAQDAAFDKLADLVSVVDKSAISEGVDQFFFRLQYIYHLSKAMDYVPASTPFQNGAVWWQSIEFAVVPRALNPNKGRLDASVKATQFTGIEYLKGEDGVSFSLGYFADCYVDFGFPGMFIALAVLAGILSFIYRFFLLKTTKNLVINYSIIAAIFIQFSLFETDGTILFGRIFTTFVVFLFFKFTLFKRMEKFITS